MIIQCPAILSGEWMLIGRQEKTQFGGIIDLLAIAPDGSLVLIELKRDKTPREIVAQPLGYACSDVHNSGSGIGMEIPSPPFAAATSFPPIKIITRPRTASLSGQGKRPEGDCQVLPCPVIEPPSKSGPPLSAKLQTLRKNRDRLIPACPGSRSQAAQFCLIQHQKKISRFSKNGQARGKPCNFGATFRCSSVPI